MAMCQTEESIAFLNQLRVRRQTGNWEFSSISPPSCQGRGRGFESRHPRHSFQKSCADFSKTNEGAKGHAFVPLLVSLFPIAMKSDEALDTSDLSTAAKALVLFEGRRRHSPAFSWKALSCPPGV